MKVLVDTCGWIEWLTDGILADKFAPYIIDLDNLIVPTSIQYELHKWICREQNEELAIEIISLTQQANVIPLSESLALLASEVSHKYGVASLRDDFSKFTRQYIMSLIAFADVIHSYVIP